MPCNLAPRYGSVRLIVVALMLSHVASGQAAAPAAAAGSHFHAVFAIPDVFPYKDADAVVVRRTNRLPHDLVIVRRERLSPALLSEAAFTLQVLRSRYGDDLPGSMLVRVHSPGPQRPHAAEASKWQQFLLTRTAHELPGFGNAAQMGLWLSSTEVHVRPNR